MNLRAGLLFFLAMTLIPSASFAAAAASPGAPHQNFRVAVYIPVQIVEHMKDRQWLETSWADINRQVKVDKVYIETYRSGVIADDALIDSVKKFFLDRGVQVGGGIAFAAADSKQFRSFCYTDPKERAYVRHVSELTARHFDDIILDDFFFNNTKTDSDIAAKDGKSWSQFRLGLMDEVAQDLVVNAARAVNPNVKITIKFPNWYPHFQGLGYDLDQEPKIFNSIYTGTETRDPVATDQQLQQYESYQIFRYFENIKPGGNLGGWVDTYDIRYVDRYSEELWDTMLAKAPEITLFNWDALLVPAIPGDRDAWKSLDTTFNYDAMLAWHKDSGLSGPADMAAVAGYSLAEADSIVGQLGRPIGLKSYKPYQSSGEDYLHNYLGMIGIPIDLSPTFPTDADMVLLTESAKYDPQIVGKIKGQLRAGKNVAITSGLLHALQGHGIEDIVQMHESGQILGIQKYWGAFGPGAGTDLGESKAILAPRISFLTNDAWPVVRGTANGYAAPLLLMDRYSKGMLFVLTIPENFNDLYRLPQAVLTAIRSYLLQQFPVQLDAPSQVSLFVYDNDRFVVESYRDAPVDVTVSVLGRHSQVRNTVTGAVVEGEPVPPRPKGQMPLTAERTSFKLTIPPHSFIALAEQ
ncbi:MAG: ATP-binding protein [Acidobacteriaceae bacterium]